MDTQINVMYYCIECGAVFFINRPENPEKKQKPILENVECKICHSTRGFRKLTPEHFRAPNVKEFELYAQKVDKLMPDEEPLD